MKQMAVITGYSRGRLNPTGESLRIRTAGGDGAVTDLELIAWSEEAARLDATRVAGYAPLTEKQRRRLSQRKLDHEPIAHDHALCCLERCS
jgi:hypothetical protein